jgi:hypothetical protein
VHFKGHPLRVKEEKKGLRDVDGKLLTLTSKRVQNLESLLEERSAQIFHLEHELQLVQD